MGLVITSVLSRQSTRNTNQWLLGERLGLLSLTESVPITHRTSGDSEVCPPTCSRAFGIGAPEAVHEQTHVRT